jgi:hypothetical protein
MAVTFIAITALQIVHLTVRGTAWIDDPDYLAFDYAFTVVLAGPIAAACCAYWARRAKAQSWLVPNRAWPMMREFVVAPAMLSGAAFLAGYGVLVAVQSRYGLVWIPSLGRTYNLVSALASLMTMCAVGSLAGYTWRLPAVPLIVAGLLFAAFVFGISNEIALMNVGGATGGVFTLRQNSAVVTDRLIVTGGLCAIALPWLIASITPVDPRRARGVVSVVVVALGVVAVIGGAERSRGKAVHLALNVDDPAQVACQFPDSSNLSLCVPRRMALTLPLAADAVESTELFERIFRLNQRYPHRLLATTGLARGQFDIDTHRPGGVTKRNAALLEVVMGGFVCEGLRDGTATTVRPPLDGAAMSFRRLAEETLNWNGINHTPSPLPPSLDVVSWDDPERVAQLIEANFWRC